MSNCDRLKSSTVTDYELIHVNCLCDRMKMEIHYVALAYACLVTANVIGKYYTKFSIIMLHQKSRKI